MEAAEDGEQEARDNWQWKSQEHRDYPVAPHPADFKESVTPYPHSVAAAHRHRLSYHILKRHLETQGGDVGEEEGEEEEETWLLSQSSKLQIDANALDVLLRVFRWQIFFLTDNCFPHTKANCNVRLFPLKLVNCNKMYFSYNY